jgi:hypothetical protein
VTVGYASAAAILRLLGFEASLRRTREVVMLRLQVVEIAAQGAGVVAALAAVFLRIGGDHAFGLFYLLLRPTLTSQGLCP